MRLTWAPVRFPGTARLRRDNRHPVWLDDAAGGQHGLKAAIGQSQPFSSESN
jgi:hypothetical protein